MVLKHDTDRLVTQNVIHVLDNVDFGPRCGVLAFHREEVESVIAPCGDVIMDQTIGGHLDAMHLQKPANEISRWVFHPGFINDDAFSSFHKLLNVICCRWLGAAAL